MEAIAMGTESGSRRRSSTLSDPACPTCGSSFQTIRAGERNGGDWYCLRCEATFVDPVPRDDPAWVVPVGEGTRFHLDPGCVGTSRTVAPEKTTIGAAIEDGFGPCKVCARENDWWELGCRSEVLE